ncbi:M20 family metallopeptidase [Thermoproteota archaeon]
MFSEKRLIKLTRDLIKIDSQNPPGDEKAIACHVRDFFAESRLPTRLIQFGKNRYNTITVIKGKSSKKSLLVTPHLDTVPFGRNWKYPPLSAHISQGRIYGRGATDCKGNLAVGMQVVRDLVDEGLLLNYDIIFCATADEEAGSYHGLIPLLEKKYIRPSYALILDSNEADIIITQKGLLHIKVEIEGKKAHGAYPDRGINAIDLALDFIKKLKKVKFPKKRHKLLKPTTINIGAIKGGDKVNMVPDWCEVEIDIRYLSGMSRNLILKKYDRF